MNMEAIIDMVIPDNTSYIVNPDIANFIIWISIHEINIFFPIFIFSFLSFSLYIGFIINRVTSNSSAVKK